MKKFKISHPSLKDLLEIIKLWEKQYEYHYRLDSDYYVSNSKQLTEKFKRYLKKAIQENKPYILIAKMDSKIIGFITFEQESADYFDTKIKKYGEIIELYVDENFRQQGVGKELMRVAEDHFLKLGTRYVKAQASTLNKRAEKFYQHLGYTNRQTLFFKKIKR